jgi:hypothetical protein
MPAAFSGWSLIDDTAEPASVNGTQQYAHLLIDGGFDHARAKYGSYKCASTVLVRKLRTCDAVRLPYSAPLPSHIGRRKRNSPSQA